MSIPDYRIPKSALHIMRLIREIEVGDDGPNGYNVIYSNKQGRLPKPITQMTLLEVQKGQSKQWANYNNGRQLTKSSATGAYQFMYKTLGGLIEEHELPHGLALDRPLQDWLGYQLLIRRGFFKWMNGQIGDVAFGNNLSKEWASFPVLSPSVKAAHRTVKRGQSYYAGDGLNKALVAPKTVEVTLKAAKKIGHGVVNVGEDQPPVTEPPAKPIPTPPDVEPPVTPPTSKPEKPMQNPWFFTLLGVALGGLGGTWFGGETVIGDNLAAQLGDWGASAVGAAIVGLAGLAESARKKISSLAKERL